MSRVRAVVVFKAAPAVRWHAAPHPVAFDRAAEYLRLETSPGQAQKLVRALGRAPVVRARAEDVLKACRREPLPEDRPEVQRVAAKIKAGRKLRPVLLATLADGNTDVADGLHRLSAVFHADPGASVAVVHAGGPQPQEGRKTMKTKKLTKAAGIADPAACRAVAQAASLLDPYAEDPLVAGLVSKMRAILDSSTPDDGDTKLEKALRRMTKLRKSDDLSPREAEHLRDASRAAQLEYLHQVSPAAAAAFEQARAAEERRFA